MCPRPRCPRPRCTRTFFSLDEVSIGQCVPWTMRTLDNVSLGHCVPWKMCPFDNEKGDPLLKMAMFEEDIWVTTDEMVGPIWPRATCMCRTADISLSLVKRSQCTVTGRSSKQGGPTFCYINSSFPSLSDLLDSQCHMTPRYRSSTQEGQLSIAKIE